MHIYAFGSICRGELDLYSDIDLISITEENKFCLDPNIFSIYSHKRIFEIWEEGNPFAWHLSSESKLIYSSDNSDFILTLGNPNEYNQYQKDCEKFYNLFLNSMYSLNAGSKSIVFELSTIFLAMRNIATCYQLGIQKIKDFSRHSAIHIHNNPLKLPHSVFQTFENARLISTRAVGAIISPDEILEAVKELKNIKIWMEKILKEVK